ncbi:OB-fold protein [Flavobacterium sp. PLA-1-15]|uniref:OB-fold protein n=1 Tax=Flavobacterium sp. PLA-1-15 TaxID=3380533 RepID=UPI003B7CD6C8
MKNKILIFIGIVLVASAAVYFYAYKGHRDIASESADFKMSVSGLSKEFSENDSLANSKYADKTVEIYGKVSNLDASSHTIIVDEKLSVVFLDSILPKINANDSIKVKGRFVGYDDLLEEFKVDQATLSN